MTNQIIPSNTTALLVADHETEVINLVRKIIRMAPGGRKLNKEQSVELAVFSLMNDLNPFNGESYYLPGMGPVPGIAGYRRKAKDWIAANLGAQYDFYIEFVPAQPGEADFDPAAGDIAYKAILHDEYTREKWEQRILSHFIEMKKEGIEGDVWALARELAGPEPTWEAVGVVDHRETFARGENPDRWDRHERAKKRAEKWAIRKKYPSVIIADRDLGEDLIIDADFIEKVAGELHQPAPERPAEEIVAELGFEDKKTTKTPQGRSWPDSFIRALIESRVAVNEFNATAILNGSPFNEESNPKDVVEWGKQYRAFRDEGQTPLQARKSATEIMGL